MDTLGNIPGLAEDRGTELLVKREWARRRVAATNAQLEAIVQRIRKSHRHLWHSYREETNNGKA